MLVALASTVITAQSWTMVLGGDIMLNGIRASAAPLNGVAKTFFNADFAYANLEIPITAATARTARKTKAELRARRQYILSADTEHIDGLAACGLDVVSLGNNHAMDHGYRGLLEMQKLLTARSILFCGAGENISAARKHVVYTTKAGTRIAVMSFLAFQTAKSRWKCTPATDSSPGVAEISLNTALIRRLVTAARKESDIVMVALHWGFEKQTVPSQYQVKLGRAFIDAGADLVVGSHPHVWQGAEMYKNKPIFYSLGNLVSPRPSATGLARLTYQGNALKKMEFLPGRISNGAVTQGSKGGADFASLCKTVAAKYPSKWARQPKIR